MLAPAAKWRSQIVPAGDDIAEVSASVPASAEPAAEPVAPETSLPSEPDKSAGGEPGKNRRRRNYSWSELIRRVFTEDVTVCGKCGGKLRLISPIHPPVATRKILDHLGLPSKPPPLTPAARAEGPTFTFDWA